MYSFYKKYFLVNLQDYPNIGIDFQITVFLFIFTIALIITTIAVNINRANIELLVKQLMRHEATDESRAKSLSELNIDKKSLKHLLSKSGGQLTQIVARVGEEKLSYEEYIERARSKGYKEDKIDFDNAKFYIKEEGQDRAKRIVEMGNPSVLNTVLFCLFIVAVFVCISLLMPGILSLVDSFLEAK